MTSNDISSTRMYRASTGYAPVDALRFAQAPKIEARRHDDSDIILSRVANYGRVGTLTRAERDADEPDMLSVSLGCGTVVDCNIAGSRYQVKPGRKIRTLFLPAGADCWVNFSAAAYTTSLFFPRGYLDSLVPGDGTTKLAPVCHSEDPRFHQIMRLLEAEITEPGVASSLMIEGLCRALAALITGINTQAIDQQADRIHLSPSRTKRVLAYIDAHLDRDITVADMATIAELSPFHFARVFKRATGLSPYHYVRERRLAMSRKLLTESGLSIAELALICGFANQSHFTAAFSKAMGMPPARYRQTSTG